jgi:hypothetical protein
MGEWMYRSTFFLTSTLVAGEWSASSPAHFTPGERAPGTHWTGGWVDLRAGLDDVEKRKNILLCRWILVILTVTHPFNWCMYADAFLNSLMCKHCVFLGFLAWKPQLCCTYVFVFIWHIPYPTAILTNSGSGECNVIQYKSTVVTS